MDRPFELMLVQKSDRALRGVSILGGKVCNKEARFYEVRVPVISRASFQQTLLDSGKIGNKINVSYREFSADLARPAFNNEVEYDLLESSVIGYKGAQIEVIEATNQLIRYRVLSNFKRATQ